MTTPAEQEAKRRYPVYPDEVSTLAPGVAERRAFVDGAAFERERLQELLEAARELMDAYKNVEKEGKRFEAAVAALKE